MAFPNVDQLLARFRDLGAERVFCKRMSENDNSKQQIYLGSDFEVLSFFPYGQITAYTELKDPNFKAPLMFFWVDSEIIDSATHTQLILYPAYPEVRLSGFLLGCKSAPSAHLQAVPKNLRRGRDGRVLVFGTTGDGRTLAHLAAEGTPLAQELLAEFERAPPAGLFLELTLPIGSASNKARVLDALRQIHLSGFLSSRRRNIAGEVIDYKAPNGGGYTLEALLGITPNGDAEPDYLGWEIKAHSQSRITLLTPEPKGGFYAANGAKAFVMRYGHPLPNGSTYFTGTHYVGKRCQATGLLLEIAGFDPLTPTKLEVGGSIRLLDKRGNEAASWAFAQLLTHWNRKHAFAAYVPYISQADPRAYRYESPILMGEHTDFAKYLSALNSGAIAFDPGSKVTPQPNGKTRIKARSQFRITTKHLAQLYSKLTSEPLVAVR